MERNSHATAAAAEVLPAAPANLMAVVADWRPPPFKVYRRGSTPISGSKDPLALDASSAPIYHLVTQLDAPIKANQGKSRQKLSEGERTRPRVQPRLGAPIAPARRAGSSPRLVAKVEAGEYGSAVPPKNKGNRVSTGNNANRGCYKFHRLVMWKTGRICKK